MYCFLKFEKQGYIQIKWYSSSMSCELRTMQYRSFLGLLSLVYLLNYILKGCTDIRSLEKNILKDFGRHIS